MPLGLKVQGKADSWDCGHPSLCSNHLILRNAAERTWLQVKVNLSAGPPAKHPIHRRDSL
jgi:hypothetical protein